MLIPACFVTYFTEQFCKPVRGQPQCFQVIAMVLKYIIEVTICCNSIVLDSSPMYTPILQ